MMLNLFLLKMLVDMLAAMPSMIALSCSGEMDMVGGSGGVGFLGGCGVCILLGSGCGSVGVCGLFGGHGLRGVCRGCVL